MEKETDKEKIIIKTKKKSSWKKRQRSVVPDEEYWSKRQLNNEWYL